MAKRSIFFNLLLLLVAAGGCAAGVQEMRPSPSVSRVPLDRERPAAETVGSLQFRGALDLTGVQGVVGLSGLWVAPDGSRFVAIGDSGTVAAGGLAYDSAGRLADARSVSSRPLPIDEGTSRKGRRTDAEELVRIPDAAGGGWLVSFERDHRFLHYGEGPDGPAGKPLRIEMPLDAAETAPRNGGLEAVTILADGRLLAIEEGEEAARQEHRLWVSKKRFDAASPPGRQDWEQLTYRSAPQFRPAGAAALPDGGLLVLERRFSLIGGWGSRIVRVAAPALRPGGTVNGKELARLEPPMMNDNFEGIAVRQDPAGETLVYLISDDNGSPLQRTYLVMFALPAP
ncbi:esterase-like activity of phytase family protein [Azospirillum thermophilum]|uniref:Phytase-like domain-containing protein n=1 Tax=Azospirillum thermophilum TaxID=2202148 RepID=A0A2S2CXI0_9PROT|nr:esterase-like activity of phytase family protein [Azospirillum thermophilum]AWK89223.1 hypothetical protein DEW08_24950 [Azospirillum thermophilum]